MQDQGASDQGRFTQRQCEAVRVRALEIVTRSAYWNPAADLGGTRSFVDWASVRLHA